MSKVAIAGDPSGTGTFTISAPNGNTDRTLVLPDEAGTVLTSASGIPASQLTGVPAFSAYMSNGNTNQTISSDVWTKVNIDTKEFDTDNCFNTSTNLFTPTVAGYYQVTGNIYLRNFSSSALKIVGIFKNGAIYKQGHMLYFTGNYYIAADSFQVSCLVYMNGTTDNIGLYGYISSPSPAFGYSSDTTYLQAVLVRAD